MKQLLSVFLYVFAIAVHAQSTEVAVSDTYKSLMKAYKTYAYANDEKALTYLHRAKQLESVQTHPKQAVAVFYQIARCHERLGNVQKALETIETVILKSMDAKDTLWMYKSFLTKGNINAVKGDHSEALVNYLQSMEYATLLENPIYELSPLSNIAYIKKTHKDFEEAIEIYKEILRQLDKLAATKNVKIDKLKVYMNIADAYVWQKDTVNATAYNEKGLALCTPQEFPALYYPLLMNKAIISYQKEAYTASAQMSTEVKEYAAAHQQKNLYQTALFYLGKNAYRQKAFQTSVKHLTQVLDSITISEQIDINEKEVHEYLALGYHKLENPEKSLHHFQQYATLEKKQSAEDLKINNETHKLVDMVPLQSEIETLGAELTKEKSDKNSLLLVTLLTSLLCIGSILYYKRRVKNIRKKFDVLLQKVQTLEASDGKVPTKVTHEPDAHMQLLLQKITDFEQSDVFLSQNCNLKFMAETLHTNTSYLSKAINTYKGKSFTKYITELRINAALVRIKNDKLLRSYTIKAIAEEFGFKRQETFSKAFKQHTGIYPSQYIRNLQKKHVRY